MHIDDSARPKFVTPESNKIYYEMIKELYNKTGVPLVLNTSFKKHGLPILETSADAFDHLVWECVEVDVIGTFVFF